MDFETRFGQLNDAQRAAVKKIDGPLLVLAGPGTGKTELLSMRAAEILKKTDTLPSSILCLTFTDSAAANMRERLRGIIGEDAYKVAIHTFHSFGVEIINQNSEFFFGGAEFKPADELAQYQIMRSLFEKLDWNHPLASKNQDDFVYLRDVLKIISEFKKSGLSADELREIIASNQQTIDGVEAEISQIFAGKITKDVILPFSNLAKKASGLDQPKLPAGIASYSATLALSMAHAAQEAIETDKTRSITAWKNAWCEKNERGEMVLKDSRHAEKLSSTIELYEQYQTAMNEAGLFDFDDMILNVIRAVENHADLRANLQEKFQYVMVDEFQDTNLAQLRLLFSLAPDKDSNAMVVGDDDQAIFSFQGADVGNIQEFRKFYNDPEVIVLTTNYRSAPDILTAARQVITQGEDRLENTTADLSKELTPFHDNSGAEVRLEEYASIDDERSSVASQIRQLIEQGTAPENIAVIARQHSELVSLLPFLSRENILVNYERRDNALDHEIVKLIEKLSRIIVAIHQSDHDTANALLPELLAHPAFNFSAIDIWKLSLHAYKNRQLWLETMLANPTFKPFAEWLITQSTDLANLPLEQQIDQLIGTSDESESQAQSSNLSLNIVKRLQPEQSGESESQSNNLNADAVKRLQPEQFIELSGAKGGIGIDGCESDDRDLVYISPVYNYHFSPEKLSKSPDAYLSALEALRTIRNQLREHYTDKSPNLIDLLSFIDLYQNLGASLTIVRHRADHQTGHINLMTAHKAKGLEFKHVFVIGAIDNTWGEKVRSRSRNIRYPANLQLQPSGGNYDERLRLFFVAMTRAEKTLTISYSVTDEKGKDTLVASFLSTKTANEQPASQDLEALTANAEIDWRGYLTDKISADLKSLLQPTLENYKLSATHLNNFLDVSRGGPQTFLLNNLLRFPSAKSPNANYGTAMHATLQQAHNAMKIDGKLPDLSKILDNFSRLLADQHLNPDDFTEFNDRGRTALQTFLDAKASSFTDSQSTEISFSNQGVVIDQARLTGALDLADIDKSSKTIFVTDYKTGKPSPDWKGKSDYDKIKLHKYRQQLMFYQILVENSRDYSGYEFTGGRLQFVEPDRNGDILSLEDNFSAEELDSFKQLILIIWQKIINLDLPDISDYEPNYKGMLQFEADLLEKS